MPNPTLRRELGLIDLIFMHVLWTISTIWMGRAAKAGPAHVVLWPLAVILLYVPLILVVLHLSRIMPVEGGLYQWTKRAFGESAACRKELLEILLSGLGRPNVKRIVLPRLRRWFPERLWFRSHLLSKTTEWPEVEAWPLLFGILVSDEDPSNQIAAAQGITTRWGGDEDKYKA